MRPRQYLRISYRDDGDGEFEVLQAHTDCLDEFPDPAWEILNLATDFMTRRGWDDNTIPLELIRFAVEYYFPSPGYCGVDEAFVQEALALIKRRDDAIEAHRAALQAEVEQAEDLDNP